MYLVSVGLGPGFPRAWACPRRCWFPRAGPRCCRPGSGAGRASAPQRHTQTTTCQSPSCSPWLRKSAPARGSSESCPKTSEGQRCITLLSLCTDFHRHIHSVKSLYLLSKVSVITQNSHYMYSLYGLFGGCARCRRCWPRP